jgi:hypothetical protein
MTWGLQDSPLTWASSSLQRTEMMDQSQQQRACDEYSVTGSGVAPAARESSFNSRPIP